MTGVPCGIWDSAIIRNYSLSCLLPYLQSCFLHFLPWFSQERLVSLKCWYINPNPHYKISFKRIQTGSMPRTCQHLITNNPLNSDHPRFTRIWEEEVCTPILAAPHKKKKKKSRHKIMLGNSLAGQWLGLCTFTIEGINSTKTPQDERCSQKQTSKQTIPY